MTRPGLPPPSSLTVLFQAIPLGWYSPQPKRDSYAVRAPGPSQPFPPKSHRTGACRPTELGKHVAPFCTEELSGVGVGAASCGLASGSTFPATVLTTNLFLSHLVHDTWVR